MKTKLQLLLCLAAALAARAANLVGDQALFAPYAVNEPVNAVGIVTLSSPGVYSATTWNLVGPLRLAAPGDYTLIATNGSINVTGTVSGPAAGRAVLRVSYTRALSLVGATAANVTVIDDTKTPPPAGEVASAPLTNLSTRARLATGGSLTVGFVVGGGASQRVLVRAVGPGLAAFGVSGSLADPRVEVFSGSNRIAANDDGGDDATLAAATAAAGTFALDPAGKDAALVLTLAPGAYTMLVQGSDADDRGEVLAEVYLVP